jgi:type VI secretion system Hcp family effector
MSSKSHMCRNVSTMLTMALFVAFSAGAAQAANQYRVKIKAAHTAIPEFSAQSVLMVMASEAGTGSGMGKGRRQHVPIKIVKEWGGASPQLQRAVETNETFPEVVIDEIANTGGKEQLVRTIRLSNALITKISKAGKPNGSAGRGEMEEVSLTYDKMEIVTPRKGKTAATDAWSTQK